MLKLLQGILANKITTEDVTTSGAPRMRGQLTCGTDCNGCAKCAAVCPTGAVAHVSYTHLTLPTICSV